MEEVISFYDAGGGIGKGLLLPNQSLSSDSLHLSENEKNALLAFMKSLNEEIKPEKAPASLPESTLPELKNRKVGGHY
jgi:cytochrome c peroxidase